MDIVLILLGGLALLCGGVLYFIADGNVRDFDYWWNNGASSYREMVNLRNAAIGIMIVGAVLLLAGIIILAVRKTLEANRRQVEAAVGQSQGSTRLCPFCGQPAGTGKFCGQCGRQLPEREQGIQTDGGLRDIHTIVDSNNTHTDAAVPKKGTISVPFILLLCVLPTVDILNTLFNILSLIYRHLLHHVEVPMAEIIAILISAGKTMIVWCMGLLPILLFTAFRKIDPGRIRVRDVILWSIWSLSGLSVFRALIESIMSRYGISVLAGYRVAQYAEDKLSLAWLWPWLLLILFLLVRSGALRPSKIKFFVTAGLLAMWSLSLLFLIYFLFGGMTESGARMEHIADFLRIWLIGQIGQSSYLPELYACVSRYLRIWALFVWLEELVEIWFVAVYGAEKLKWSGLAFVLGLPLFTFFMTFINIVVMMLGESSYPLAMGAGAVIGFIALTVLFIVEKCRENVSR